MYHPNPPAEQFRAGLNGEPRGFPRPDDVPNVLPTGYGTRADTRRHDLRNGWGALPPYSDTAENPYNVRPGYLQGERQRQNAGGAAHYTYPPPQPFAQAIPYLAQPPVGFNAGFPRANERQNPQPQPSSNTRRPTRIAAPLQTLAFSSNPRARQHQPSANSSRRPQQPQQAQPMFHDGRNAAWPQDAHVYMPNTQEPRGRSQQPYFEPGHWAVGPGPAGYGQPYTTGPRDAFVPGGVYGNGYYY